MLKLEAILHLGPALYGFVAKNTLLTTFILHAPHWESM